MSFFPASAASPATATNLQYFLAGALLPTIAFGLMSRYNRLHKPTSSIISYDDDDDDDEDDAEDDDFDRQSMIKGPSASWGLKDAPYKMLLVVNKELKMGKGKIAAQCCHAAVACSKIAQTSCPAGLRAWERTGCAKIAVLCPTEDEMVNDLLPKAMSRDIPLYLVEDAGRTQIAAGSRTVLGLGPAPTYAFEGVTDHLKLM